jgi:hypothetical protein
LVKRGRGDKYLYEQSLESISDGCGRAGTGAMPPVLISVLIVVKINMLLTARHGGIK